MLVPTRSQYGNRKQTEASVTEFCYKSKNLSLEEHDNSLGRHVNDTVMVSLKLEMKVSLPSCYMRSRKHQASIGLQCL